MALKILNVFSDSSSSTAHNCDVLIRHGMLRSTGKFSSQMRKKFKLDGPDGFQRYI